MVYGIRRRSARVVNTKSSNYGHRQSDLLGSSSMNSSCHFCGSVKAFCLDRPARIAPSAWELVSSYARQGCKMFRPDRFFCLDARIDLYSSPCFLLCKFTCIGIDLTPHEVALLMFEITECCCLSTSMFMHMFCLLLGDGEN